MRQAVIFIALSVTFTQAMVCPVGWERYTGTADTCIAAYKKEMSWLDANNFCKSLRADLVSIHNSFQNLHAATIAEKKFEACRYWIGLYNIDKDKKFKWTDKSSVDYTNWLQGEPPSVAEATTVYMSLQSRFRWVTTTEVAENNCFICEKRFNEPSTNPESTTETFESPSTGAPTETIVETFKPNYSTEKKLTTENPESSSTGAAPVETNAGTSKP
ncbi:unnamed protein product, partial [Enterobius vermicularis]|uniref:C-type lectin domain-containing protein n=1 Tax=Enterobius vermicularis TaxID=51028 RepID=A0A0N4UZ86_ENTVE